MPSIYQFTRNTEEREMLKLGLVKPNSHPMILNPIPGATLHNMIVEGQSMWRR